MPTRRRARLTERSYYPALIDEIRRQGGSGVSEVTYVSDPDIVFQLGGRTWLLSVKIDETNAILKSAFLQYQRHKDESGLTHGLVLFLPTAARNVGANADDLATAIQELPVGCLVDTPDLKREFRGLTFPQLMRALRTDVVPNLDERISSPYPMNFVISVLQQHVRDMMEEVRLDDEVLLATVTDSDLLTGISTLKRPQADAVGRFLASYIVLSQVLFLRLLGAARPEILPPLRRPADITHDWLRRAFKRVLDINYKPIFELDVLDAISVLYLRDTFELIWGLEVERVRHELPGRIFHELMPQHIRKMLAAFYTRPVAADLLARLTLPNSDATVFDPACGSGTILTAAYRRKLDLHHSEGRTGDPHRRFTEQHIFGADIMPFAVHLTSANLSAMDPRTEIAHTQIIRGDSLHLSVGEHYRYGLQFAMFPTATSALAATGEDVGIDIHPVDAVLMNPPFTKVERGISRYVDMERFRDQSGGEAGLWAHFVGLADHLLVEGGTIGAVLPISILRGRESGPIRRFLLDEYTIDFILKPTKNYGFSEWAEYRDIILVARKGRAPAHHKVKFALVKTDLTTIATESIEHIADRIVSESRVRHEDLEVESFDQQELRDRSDNLMWFCGPSSFRARDVLVRTASLPAESLGAFPQASFREGYRPVPLGVSKFMFVTRPITPSRTEEAFLRLTGETSGIVTATSPGGARYNLERSAFVRSLRTGIGIDQFDITGLHDYLAVHPYKSAGTVRRASGFREPVGRNFHWADFWETVRRDSENVATHLVVVHRINPYSPNTNLIAFFSEDIFSPSNVLNVVRAASVEEAKAICVTLNSVLFLANFFLAKEDATGRYINVRFYDLYGMDLYPLGAAVKALVGVFEKFRERTFPSLSDQLDEEFEARYQQYWSRERGGQPALLDLEREPVRPSAVRVEFDEAVLAALGIELPEDELIEIYSCIVREMILTRGLRRD